MAQASVAPSHSSAMLCSNPPTGGALGQVLSSLAVGSKAGGAGGSLLAQKLRLAPAEQHRLGEASKGQLPTCQVKNAPSELVVEAGRPHADSVGMFEASALHNVDQLATHVNAVSRGVRSILASPVGSSLPAGASLESLYLLTERIVLGSGQGAELLYSRVKVELERGIGQVSSSLRAGPSQETADASLAWLQRLEAAWQDWCDKARLMGSMLTLLNQAYLLEQAGMLSLWDLSMQLFKDAVIMHEEMRPHTTACIVTCANAERWVGTAIERLGLH